MDYATLEINNSFISSERFSNYLKRNVFSYFCMAKTVNKQCFHAYLTFADNICFKSYKKVLSRLLIFKVNQSTYSHPGSNLSKVDLTVFVSRSKFNSNEINTHDLTYD